MVKKYQYYNRWSNFIFLALICVLSEIMLIFVILNIEMNSNLQLALIFLSLNISSMIFTASSILGYIHYKSPHYEIIIDKEMIIVPKYALIPDSHFIYFQEIIFFSEISSFKKPAYKIIYNGGSVIIKKELLRNPDDINEIVYYLKEAAL